MVFIVMLLVAGTIYILIPSRINFTYSTKADCTETAATRMIIKNKEWDRWWPGVRKDSNYFNFKDTEFKIDKILLNGFQATIISNGNSAKGYLQVFASTDTSIILSWSGVSILSNNPVKRIIQYLQAKEINIAATELVNKMSEYFSDQKNIYGFKAVEERVKDSSMITIKKVIPHYPSTEEIYEQVNLIKAFTLKKGVKQKGQPLLNITKTGADIYQFMVGIPVEKDIASEGIFELKKMILGNVIRAQINGGVATVRKGEEQLFNYINDYKRSSPAIPFEELVTSRIEEKDSLKWITNLYYPVFKKTSPY